MRTLVVIENLSLDGVMQAPGGVDEDPEGGFEHGGWAHYEDPVRDEFMGRRMAESRDEGTLLLGRRTYEILAVFRPRQPANPVTDWLNAARKHVASTTLREPLGWVNSTLLTGDLAGAVARLKREPGGGIAVLGSGQVVRELMRHGLVDEYLLTIHPLVLGAGRRLFADQGAPARMELTQSVATGKGALIAHYRAAPAGT